MRTASTLKFLEFRGLTLRILPPRRSAQPLRLLVRAHGPALRLGRARGREGTQTGARYCVRRGRQLDSLTERRDVAVQLGARGRAHCQGVRASGSGASIPACVVLLLGSSFIRIRPISGFCVVGFGR